MYVDQNALQRKDAAIERLKSLNYQSAWTPKEIMELKSLNYGPFRTLEESDEIIPFIEQTIDDIMEAWRPWREGRTYGEAWENLYKVIVEEGLLQVYSETRDEANSELPFYAYADEVGKGWGHSKEIGDYVALELIRGISSIERNPMDSIISLYEIGLRTPTFAIVDGEEKFLVDIPLNIDGIPLMGCYVQGDEKILYTHSWTLQAHDARSIDGDTRLNPLTSKNTNRKFGSR